MTFDTITPDSLRSEKNLQKVPPLSMMCDPDHDCGDRNPNKFAIAIKTQTQSQSHLKDVQNCIFIDQSLIGLKWLVMNRNVKTEYKVF